MLRFIQQKTLLNCIINFTFVANWNKMSSFVDVKVQWERALAFNWRRRRELKWTRRNFSRLRNSSNDRPTRFQDPYLENLRYLSGRKKKGVVGRSRRSRFRFSRVPSVRWVRSQPGILRECVCAFVCDCAFGCNYALRFSVREFLSGVNYLDRVRCTL